MDDITLSSGRTLSPLGGIIGLDSTTDHVFHGYDGRLHSSSEFAFEEEALTPAELVELADIMVARWSAFRARFAEQCSAIQPKS